MRKEEGREREMPDDATAKEGRLGRKINLLLAFLGRSTKQLHKIKEIEFGLEQVQLALFAKECFPIFSFSLSLSQRLVLSGNGEREREKKKKKCVLRSLSTAPFPLPPPLLFVSPLSFPSTSCGFFFFFATFWPVKERENGGPSFPSLPPSPFFPFPLV